MRRFLPMAIAMAFAVWLLVALILGLMFPKTGAISFIGGTIAGVGVATLVFVKKRAQLRRQYGQQQRLILHTGGLRKFDHATVIDMPWTGITHLQTVNSSLPPGGRVHGAGLMQAAANAAVTAAHTAIATGIVGAGTITPLADAPNKVLAVMDRTYQSNLRSGQPHQTGSAVIFPREFDHDWVNGTIGAWLCHYRPDIHLA